MEIRPYRRGDEAEILKLDARELPSKWNSRNLENWKWKFLDSNPAGPSFIWVAELKDQIVAHFAAVPYRLKVFNTEVLASHSIGALVESRYQNRGLLKLVGDRLLGELKENGVVCTWGFPNQRAYEFEKKALGYQDLINFNEWYLARNRFPGQFSSTATRSIDMFDTSFDDLWQRCSNDYTVISKRDSEYLNWRYLERPDLEYFPFAFYEQNQVQGYVVLKLYREEDLLRGHILDIFARKNDVLAISSLIERSLAFFYEREVDEVTVWFWGNHLVSEILQSNGFEAKKTDRPLIIRMNDDSLHSDNLLDKSNWYFTMGDSTEIF
jgi:hypothetical protein